MGDVAPSRDAPSCSSATTWAPSASSAPPPSCCSRGQIATRGEIGHVIDAYMNAQLGGKTSGYTAGGLSLRKDIPVAAAWASNAAGEPSSPFLHHEEITLNVTCRVNNVGTQRRAAPRGRRLTRPARVRLGRVPSDACTSRAEAGSGHGLHREELPASRHLRRLLRHLREQPTRHRQRQLMWSPSSCRTPARSTPASEGMDYGCVFAPCEWKVEASDGQPAEQTVRAVG